MIKLEKKIINRFEEVRGRCLAKKNKENKSMYFSYPGKVFYTDWIIRGYEKELRSYNLDFKDMFVMNFVKDGKFHAEVVFNRFFEKTLNSLKGGYLDFLENDSRKLKIIEKKNTRIVDKLSVNFKKNQKLGVYFKIIKELEELFIETNNYNEFSTVVELFIEDEIDKLFENSGLSKEALLLLASSQKKSFVEKYNLEIKKLNSWAKKEKVNLANFKKAKENKRFFEKLRNVYRVGYFLNSSYAGVSFISIEDIFSDVVGFRNIKITNDINLDQLYLSLNNEQKKIIDISRYYSEQRDKRKEMQLKIFYLQARCIEEVSKIISIPRIDLENLRPCQFSEDFFDKKEVLVDLINEQKKGLFFLSTDIGSFVESGDRASVLFNNVKLKESLDSRDIKGVVACRGRARGVVRLLHNIHDNYFFEPGDILVTGMTSPNFIYVMKKAGAIVTDLGGTTCHAAIISRELDVPCIIGTKNATKILKDGDEVEVDADNGIVKIIKKYDKTKNS